VFVSLSGGGRGQIAAALTALRVGDPIGAPIGEIRRVRADIEHRVRTLLTELGVATPRHRELHKHTVV
jgi:hypothetical protein